MKYEMIKHMITISSGKKILIENQQINNNYCKTFSHACLGALSGVTEPGHHEITQLFLLFIIFLWLMKFMNWSKAPASL